MKKLATAWYLFFSFIVAAPMNGVAGAVDEFDVMVEQLNVSKAKEVLEQEYNQNPADYEVLYRMARLYILLGDQETNQDKRLKKYESAVEYANKAVSVHGKKVPGYLYRAAATGKVALFRGIFSVADEVNKVRNDCYYALKLNNGTDNQMAGVHYVLGRAHLELSYKPGIFRGPLGLGWGNLKDAYKHLSKARKLRKGFIMYELEYARCLAEKDDEEGALKVARSIGSLPAIEPGDADRKKQALELIDDLE